jgi:hypothetical protein
VQAGDPRAVESQRLGWPSRRRWGLLRRRRPQKDLAQRPIAEVAQREIAAGDIAVRMAERRAASDWRARGLAPRPIAKAEWSRDLPIVAAALGAADLAPHPIVAVALGAADLAPRPIAVAALGAADLVQHPIAVAALGAADLVQHPIAVAALAAADLVQHPIAVAALAAADLAPFPIAVAALAVMAGLAPSPIVAAVRGHSSPMTTDHCATSGLHNWAYHPPVAIPPSPHPDTRAQYPWPVHHPEESVRTNFPSID